MSYFSLIYLGIFSLIISILSFFNIIYSYYFNLYLSIDSYLYSLIFSLLFGLIFLFKRKDNYKINIYQKILTVILGYFLLPLILSIPFYLSIYNISFLDSYFETISGFTSTGFTIFENIKHLDQSLILWRSSTQWIGGLYFLFSIILLIDIFDNNLKKSLTNFLSFNISESLKQSSKILILYILLTIGIFVILKFFNIRSFDSLNLSMTLISSGGFIPSNNLSIILNYDCKSESLLSWYQQLIAESLGKKSKGILPIISTMPKDNHSLMQFYLDGPKKSFYTFFSVLEKNSSKFNKLLLDSLVNRERCKELGEKSCIFVEDQVGATDFCVPLLMGNIS